MKLKQVGIAIVIAISAAAGFYAAHTYEQSQYAKEREVTAKQIALDNAMLRADAMNWAGSIASEQGESVLRAFTAGLTPLLLAEHHVALEMAGASLLRLHGVQGVSVLRADGKVLYASDAKLTVTEGGNEQTRWALSATDFLVRDSVQPGVKEMSLPVNDAGRVLAVVWLAYDAAGIRERDRPASFKMVTPDETASVPSSAADIAPAVEPTKPTIEESARDSDKPISP